MKKLAIIEDNESIRESVIAFIRARSNFEIVLESGAAESFFSEVVSHPQIDIILLDIGLPGISGIQAIPKIKELLPACSIIILSTHETDDMIMDALSAGASSYISKRSSLVKILEAITIVSDGGAYMSPSIAKKVISKFNTSHLNQNTQLTQRQLEIVKHLSDGKTYNEIATVCDISINTVRTHIKRIYDILNVNNKYSLIEKWRDGLIG